ncbi:MAG: hypothetical protein LBU65_11175 [Planctomycetaceae bacterium]|nr:hypothetical protein [Planctomycetaceae bacterium]
MNSENDLTLPEVRQKIDDTLQTLTTLRGIENVLVQKYLPSDEQVKSILQFDDTKQMVSWVGDAIRLNKMPYLLVKTLWQSPKHRANFNTLEKYVWKRAEDKCVPIATIRSLVNRTNEVLRKNNCPYRIRPVKKKREISGFSLK